LIAASWADADIANVVRTGLMGWADLITQVARKSGHEIGGFGPFSPKEVGALVAAAFIGAESLYLLGAEKKGVPVRQALKRVGDLIRLVENSSAKG
jgi:hypothetical protein